MKKYKNFIFIILCLIISLIIITFNIYMDPYDTKNFDNTTMDHLENSKKIAYTHLNYTKKNKYEYLVIGQSYTSGISGIIYKYSCKAKDQIYYLLLEDMSFEELYDLLKYYLKLHPETKNILFAMEVGPFILNDNDRYEIPKNPPGKFADFINLYFSISATKKSVNKLISLNKRENSQNLTPGKDYYNYNEKRIFYSHQAFVEKNVNKFKRIYEFLKQKDLKVLYFIPPVNALFIVSNYENVEIFKRKIAEITPFYDYAYVNDYTTKPIGYYFTDAIHVNYNFFGKEISDLLMLNNANEEYTAFITSENINTILNQQKNLKDDYIKNNKKYIDSYLELYPSGKFNDEQYDKKLYRSDEQKVLENYLEKKYKSSLLTCG